MASLRAHLSSTSTALDDLTKRVTDAAESLAGGDDDDVATDLFEVERALRSATRRLERVVRNLKD
ncbi:MAG: hypothetical protein S0880_15575 [Actinomycetota bacterium]|nr:hypothetical protein [Actinomycetota bacterium]